MSTEWKGPNVPAYPNMSRLWQRIRAALAPMLPCAECGGHWKDIQHEWWDPGWPGMPMGREPVDHWYVDPTSRRTAMTDLRRKIIEAMANGPNPMFFKGNRESALMVAEDMLDKMLDYLEANVDETIHVEHWEGFTRADALEDTYVPDLIGALRDSRDTGEKP